MQLKHTTPPFIILIHTLTNYDHPPLMALQSPSSSSSSSSSLSPGFTYDVFISFRGIDTRFGFTGNLYKALSDKGIYTFFDDRELHGGEEITPSLFKAIEESRVAIPVFSSNYASSSFCLDELVHVMECFKEKGLLVLPIFYDVDPSHVRHQIGSYSEAMDKHEARFQNNTDDMERLQKWKMALTQAANLSGHHFKYGNGYEHEFIGKIVEVISNKISRVPLHVVDYPVGLDSRVQQVKSLLDVESDDRVLMIGICGIGGIGKTTLARETYNLIANQFEGLCFLHKVRENLTKRLQEKLLSKTTKSNIVIGDVNEGISIIKRRLRRKKVLLILDDVDKKEQLRDLAGGPDWFSPGSRVIITSRDKQLLASHRIERIYEVDGLNKEEALELLRWKAFENNKVDSSYTNVINRAVTYASGLPLALEVVGSNLFGKDIDRWQSTLDRYERIPDKDIQETLKVSFDDLQEEEKCVFLNIACFFNRYQLERLEDILCAHHDQCVKHHIGVLVEKSLIKISKIGLENCVTLHDLIEDMGKEIVRQESPKEPGKRSRLWFHEDIVYVFEENSGTSKIEIIHLKFPCSSEEKVVEWKGDGFKKMKRLKTLIIESGRFSKGPDHLPNSLRIMCWDGYPSQVLPSDFCPKKLSMCMLNQSCLTSSGLCGSLKEFVNMKVLVLCSLDYFTHTPDISGLLNLEELNFNGCMNLISIHESVGFLNKLKILSVECCSKLKSFPPLMLTSLQQLDLLKCSSLEIFPEILGEMGNITKLHLFSTGIKELPSSFQYLTGLRTLKFRGSGLLSLPSNIVMMPKLLEISVDGCRLLPKQNNNLSSMASSNVENLYLTNCDLSDDFLQISLRWFADVKTLNLLLSNFTILPESIKECRFLRNLYLDNCKRLREIRGVPPNLKGFSAEWCWSLTSSSASQLLSQKLHEAGGTDFYFKGTPGIPEWFEHRSKGRSISFWFRNKIPSIALFVADESMHEWINDKFQSFAPKMIINGYICSADDGIRFWKIVPNHTLLCDLELPKLKYNLDEALSKNEWIHVEVTSFNEISVSRWMSIEFGIHVIKQKSCMEDIQFTNPFIKRTNHNSSDPSQ